MNDNISITKEFNDNNLKEILKLKKIIAEKDTIILELHSKIREFRKDIDILKNKMIIISENTQEKEIFSYNCLQIQKIQRFHIQPHIVYQHNLNTIESISDKGNISINNLNKYFYHLQNDLNEDINSKSFLKLKLMPYKNYEFKNNKKCNYTANNFYKNKNEENNNINDVKYNSSLFFKKCKIAMSNEEYMELLSIIKLFNSKKMSKSETYERITNYLGKINPELLKEFYNLFI